MKYNFRLKIWQQDINKGYCMLSLKPGSVASKEKSALEQHANAKNTRAKVHVMTNFINK